MATGGTGPGETTGPVEPIGPGETTGPACGTRAVQPGTVRAGAARARALVPFVLYALLSAVHVLACFADLPFAGPTKLTLMPALALAAIWACARAGRPVRAGALALLLAAIAGSWLGDGAATFFPMFDDELPMMLLCFGLAHLAYLLLMWRGAGIAVRRVPRWAAVYLVAYVALMLVLIPRAGALAVPVAVYGVLLVGTAVMASRCGPAVAWGGAWFLVSDAILSIRIFLPGTLPAWSDGLVMLTYTLGQGLLVFGIVAAIARRDPAPAAATGPRPPAAGAAAAS
ncbi:lysoplasmalogenase [Leucobacter allii]|uniref:lysoplasmalogenase family protein n=1 Tax=Leucobacter allii TaxID=2932247 RepID=UPI001FD4911E|nr:lysoplasmalogenase family protein [Leucobacter allii]UOR02330.1 lysoplasmalogenase [Leucobacter allii]